MGGCASQKVVPVDPIGLENDQRIQASLDKDQEQDKRVIKIVLLGWFLFPFPESVSVHNPHFVCLQSIFAVSCCATLLHCRVCFGSSSPVPSSQRLCPSSLCRSSTGESGKSTIFKQLKILHCNGFTQEDRLQKRPLVMQNTLESIHALITACSQLNIPIEPSHMVSLSSWQTSCVSLSYCSLNVVCVCEREQEVARRLLDIKPEEVPLEAKEDIKALWNDKSVQAVFSRSNEFQLIDSAA